VLDDAEYLSNLTDDIKKLEIILLAFHRLNFLVSVHSFNQPYSVLHLTRTSFQMRLV